MNVRKLVNKIIYGGSACLNSIELGLVKSVQGALDSEQAMVLARQIEMINLVQRNHDNRMVTVYFEKRTTPPLFEDRREDLCLAKINYRLGEDKFTTSLFIHRGKLSSLETKKPLSREALLKLPEDASVTLVSTVEEDVGEALDRDEHGN